MLLFFLLTVCRTMASGEQPPPHLQPVFICEKCDLKFVNKQSLLEHKMVCQNPRRNQPNAEPIVIDITESYVDMESIDLASASDINMTSRQAVSPASASMMPKLESVVHSSAAVTSTVSNYGVTTTGQPAAQTVMHDVRSTGTPSSTTSTPDDITEDEIKFLSQFSTQEILYELTRSNYIFACMCGHIFHDRTLFYLHRGCHNTSDPMRCTYCSYQAADWYQFTSHFFEHKKAV